LSAVTISQSDVSVLKPDGTNLVSPTFVNTSGKVLSFTTPVAGTYTILVNPRTFYTGSATLKLVGLGAPAAPSLSATAGDGAVDLAWTVPAAGDAPISGYRLYRGTAPGAEAFLAEVGTVTAYHDPGLANGTRYWYQVAAVNAVGEGTRSPEVSAVPQVPATVPAAPVLSAVAGDGSVSLCWTAPPDGGSPITSYRVYRGPSAGAEAFLAETGTAASYSDTAVVNGQGYSYRVAAMNAVGEGPLSASVPAAPPGTPPSLGSFSPAVAAGGTSITIDGANLGLPGCGTTVSFGTQPGPVTAGGGTSLTATSPPAGGSGKVTVRTPAGRAVSSADFFAVPAGLAAAEIAVTARMALGESRAVALPTAGTAALVLFDGAAGGRVSLNLSGSTISQGDLSVVRPDGTNLVAPAFFNTNGVFLDTVTLPVSGTYTIVLNPRTTYTGSATLTLYDVPPDLGGSITPGGAPVTVTLAIPGQNAKVTFAGTAGRRISLNLSGSTISQGDLSVANPDGTNLVAPSLFTTNGIFLDAKTLPASGTYTILVNPRSFYAGKATLTLYDVPPDLAGSITPGGAPVTVTLAVPGQNALLSFPGVAGSSYTLTLSAVTISQSDVSVLKPDGTNLVSPTFVNTSGKKIKFTAPTTGTYTILVNPRGASTGTMTLRL
jgi:hypothetical protein